MACKCTGFVLGVNSFHSDLNYQLKDPDFLRLTVLVSCSAGKQHNKITDLFLRCQNEERALRVKENNVASEKNFNRNFFVIEGNHQSSNDKKALSLVFLQIFDPCFIETKTTRENVFIGHLFSIEGNHESSND